jgi:hypothetical protein
MKKSKRTEWWTLQWPNGDIAIDYDRQLQLYRSEKEAEIGAGDYAEPLPKPVRVRLVVGRKLSPKAKQAAWEREARKVIAEAHKALSEARKPLTSLRRALRK